MKTQLNISKSFIYFRCRAFFIVSVGLAIVSLGFTNSALAGHKLTLFENSYTAKLLGFSVMVTSRLTALNDDNYQLHFKADSVLGSVTEVSNIRWNAVEKRVMPFHYTYKRASVGKSKDEELSFNWTTHTINNLTSNKSFPFDSNAKIQDHLSYQLQMREDLIAGKNSFEYTITTGRKFKKYRFEVVGDETLSTPLGDVKTVKVKRTNTSDDTVIHAWFAKSFQYLLVQLQQEENGSAYTIYLSKAAINGKAIEHF
ncbi:MAG: DUF3108 domain-containing protein [Pseudomonadota bacterium]